MSKQFFNIQKGMSLNPQASSPSDPSNGDMYYDSTLGKFRRYEAGVWRSIIQSTINYILNSDAEGDTSGFATYADAAGVNPVDGTGGSPTVTFTRSTSSPMRGVASFLFTKDAANRQGQGSSYDFTIDSSDKAKVLDINLEYLVASGTFVAGTSTTDSDVKISIYDVTNAVLIEPSSTKLLSSSSTFSDTFRASFQTAYNSTSYRLILHCATTSALAYALQIDNISISPSKYVFGTPITDWQSFTPTGVWATNATYTGKWRRVGSNMEVQTLISLTGAPTGNLTVNLPSGFTIDTNSMVAGVAEKSMSGFGETFKAATASYPLIVDVSSSTAMRVLVSNVGATYPTNSFVAPTVPFTYANGDSVQVCYSVPILGWSSSVQMSDQTDTRVVDFYGTQSSQAVTGAVTDITFTSTKDSHGGWSTNIYTVNVPGDYTIIFNQSSSGTNATGMVYINNSFYAYGTSSTSANQQANGIVFAPNLKTGDTISVRSNVTATVSGCTLGIIRISGPSAIAASDTVDAHYTSAAGNSIANITATFIDFGTKSWDSHGSVLGAGNGNNTVYTSTWRFVAPTSGKYRVAANITLSVPASNTDTILAICVDGVERIRGHRTSYLPSGGELRCMPATGTVRLLAGQAISITGYHTAGSTRTMEANAGSNTISIEKVGNY